MKNLNLSAQSPRCTGQETIDVFFVSPSKYMAIKAAQEATKAMVRDVESFVTDRGAWVVPLGTPFAYQLGLPLYATYPSTVVKTVAVETVDAHVRTLLMTAHLPLLEVSVKPDADAVAVNDAHVPVVYQVPPLITHPFWTPLVVIERVPLPAGAPGEGGGWGVDPPVFGRYFIPVAGQSDFEPSGFVATKVPVCTLPRTLKKYQISFKAELSH